jgi:hypothetical protein
MRSVATRAVAAGLLVAGGGLAMITQSAVTQSAQAQQPRVLLVGTFRGFHGRYTSIQEAVEVARPGDWILIAPGDYHENGSPYAGVWVTTPNIHIRGLVRNAVVVDGTRPGGSNSCSSRRQLQRATKKGRNGIEVYKASGVSVENLTVCNFLASPGGSNGNEVWFNGGDGSGKIGMGPYQASYLTATSTYFDKKVGGGSYGIFVSNDHGPGSVVYSYASNMSDSGFYVGACPDCNTVLEFVRAENNALGYSGTNAGGHLIIENSEWDLNRDGIVPNSLANDDPPSPQDGACPLNLSVSCTIIRDNYVHDNNNPNTPALGLTAGAPIGTGIEISGGRRDMITRNLVTHQGSWGVLMNDYPDLSAKSVPTYCRGGLRNHPYPIGTAPCYFVAFGSTVTQNRFANNGGFDNPTNGDLADLTIRWHPSNCFTGNLDTAGPLTSDPKQIESPSVLGLCGGDGKGDYKTLFAQVVCAALNLCGTGGKYPQPTVVQLLPVPHTQPSMPDPCAGVPANPWCPSTP